MRVLLFFGIACSGCAALESWDGFYGGDTPTPAIDAGFDAGADVAPDAAKKTPIESVQVAVKAIDDERLKSVTVPLTLPERAGDLIVVVVGWYDDTAQVSAVTDTRGNTYRRAVGPTTVGGQEPIAQSIYYASPIVAAGATASTITVTFDSVADSPDIRVVEYSGLAGADALDATAASSGKSTAATSGPATTKFAHELLFGAATTQGDFGMGGAGFTVRVITPETNLVEDREVEAVGTYAADAPQPVSAGWIMQLVTFRGAT